MIRKKKKICGLHYFGGYSYVGPLSGDGLRPPPLFEYDSSLEFSYVGRMAQDADGNVYNADLRRGRDSISSEELIYVSYSVETTDVDNTGIALVYDLLQSCQVYWFSDSAY